MAFDRANHCRQIGTLGGQKTVQTYGRGYMSVIGKIGFQSYADKHHDGNRAAAVESLKLITHPDARVRQPGPFDRIQREKRLNQGVSQCQREA